MHQEKVAAFVAEHDLEAPPAYRLLDLVSELGEVAKDAAESTDYGTTPASLDVASDEIGDVLFAALAFADAVGIDAEDALDESLRKYESRMAERDRPASGN